MSSRGVWPWIHKLFGSIICHDGNDGMHLYFIDALGERHLSFDLVEESWLVKSCLFQILTKDVVMITRRRVYPAVSHAHHAVLVNELLLIHSA